MQVLSAIKNIATGLMVEARGLSEQINYLVIRPSDRYTYSFPCPTSCQPTLFNPGNLHTYSHTFSTHPIDAHSLSNQPVTLTSQSYHLSIQSSLVQAMQQQRLGVVVHELAGEGGGGGRPMSRPFEG